jgi:hypothetical protein
MVSQNNPVIPSGHVHRAPCSVLKQMPPFWHWRNRTKNNNQQYSVQFVLLTGCDWHESTMNSQLRPLYPRAHKHWDLVSLKIHRPPLRQSMPEHCSWRRPQLLPPNADGQLHRKLLTRSMQMPPFKHWIDATILSNSQRSTRKSPTGCDKHSLMFISQYRPVYPCLHRQVNVAGIVETHCWTPSVEHGFVAHRLIIWLHCTPV